MLSLSGGPFGSSLVCGCASQLATLMYPIPPTDSTLALGAPRVLPRSRSLSLSLALSLSSAASLPPCVTERRRLRSWYYSIDMASIASASHVVAPAAFAAAVPRVATSESSPVRAFTGLRSAPLIARESAEQSLGVQNGSRVSCMQVWAPTGNKKFETLSYLPPLTNDQIAKQIDYMLSKNLIPCLEFDLVGYISRTNFAGSGYYDGRYWTMWKLPMFGCSDAAAVLREIAECKKAYPKAFIRVLGFDSKRQVQITGFLVQRPDV